MKKCLVIVFSLVAAVAVMSSCTKDFERYNELIPVENPFEDAVPTGYYSYAQISVPAATDMVYIEYVYQDGTIKTIEQPVTPTVTVPTDGKEVEPFGTVRLMFQADKPALVKRVYYTMSEATKAEGEDEIYALEDFPLDQISSGEFGKTRYVQVQWNFAWVNSEETGWQNTPTYPKDVVFYDKYWNHTLHYKYAYAGGVAGEGYFLTDCYEIVDHVVTAIKNSYCESCGTGCPNCMPWGCSCGCGGWGPNGDPVLKSNPYFEPSGDTTADADSDAVVVDRGTPGTTSIGDGGTVTVGQDGTIIVDYAPADMDTVQLPEPASFSTEDGVFTTYHSYGVVMFDDRFPSLPDPDYMYDFNDVVVDYAIDAVTVADEALAAEGWREKVKVTMHVRALGGDDPISVGVVLEGFNTDYVDYLDESMTLDSGTHGELPVWTITTLQENSLHYDPLEGNPFRTDEKSKSRPALEIGRLQALNSVDGRSTGGKTSGNEVYQYIDREGNAIDHVFNPARKQWDNWKTPDESQYDEGLDALYQDNRGMTLKKIQDYKLYNTVPGYLNVAGGLYTYTVEYYIKPRADMSPEKRAACLANMIETVTNTNNQNFYIVKKNKGGAVGLKGYAPLDVKVKESDYKNGYRATYDKIVSENASHFDQSTFYSASNGMVWGFKCPVLTRHTWELMPFAVAYPNYQAWVESNGASHSDWYKDADVNYTALVCEW